MEVDTEEIRNTGEVLYPDLADKYGEAGAAVAAAQEEATKHIYPDNTTLGEALKNYMSRVGFYLSVSESHLRGCGEILVQMADDLDWVDEDNAYNIGKPSEGFEKPPDEKR